MDIDSDTDSGVPEVTEPVPSTSSPVFVLDDTLQPPA